MKKIINFLISKIKFLIIFYIILQLILCFTLKIEYSGDAEYYYKLAKESIDLNEFYPAKKHLYEDYIIAPVYINSIILLLKIHYSPVTINLFNYVIILLQVLVLYKITIKIFSKTTGRVVVLLFIFYMNTVGLMLQNYTELIFLFLLTTSIYLFTLNKISFFILSGIFIGLSIGVRPLGWALMTAMIFVQLFTGLKDKKIYFNYFYTYSGILAIILLFGTFTYSHFGKFEYTSTTGPINLLLGANDYATGGFNSTVLEQGKAGYIEFPDSMTYVQKGEFYQHRAINWVTENPGKWLSLAPLKLLHTYGWDDVSLSSLIGYNETNFARVMRILFSEGNLDNALPETNIFEKVLYLFILASSHLYYYFLLILIALGVYDLLKKKHRHTGTTIILLFTFFTILMIMITIGTPRYKYPVFILLLPFAANYLQLRYGLGLTEVEKN